MRLGSIRFSATRRSTIPVAISLLAPPSLRNVPRRVLLSSSCRPALRCACMPVFVSSSITASPRLPLESRRPWTSSRPDAAPLHLVGGHSLRRPFGRDEHVVEHDDLVILGLDGFAIAVMRFLPLTSDAGESLGTWNSSARPALRGLAGCSPRASGPRSRRSPAPPPLAPRQARCSLVQRGLHVSAWNRRSRARLARPVDRGERLLGGKPPPLVTFALALVFGRRGPRADR